MSPSNVGWAVENVPVHLNGSERPQTLSVVKKRVDIKLVPLDSAIQNTPTIFNRLGRLCASDHPSVERSSTDGAPVRRQDQPPARG